MKIKKYINYVKNNEIKFEIINKNNNISIKYEEIIESYDKLIKEKKEKKINLNTDIKKIKKQIDELQLNNLPTEISNKLKKKLNYKIRKKMKVKF